MLRVTVAALIFLSVLAVPVFGTVEYGADCIHLTVSPDGREIAYVSATSGLDYTLWRMSLDGSGLRQVGGHYDNEVRPVWGPAGRLGAGKVFSPDPGLHRVLSPNGRKIVYDSGGLWVANRDGSDRKMVRIGGRISGLAWTPDGSKLIIASSWDRRNLNGDTIYYCDIFVANADGTGLHQITHFAPWLFRSTTADIYDFGVLNAEQIAGIVVVAVLVAAATAALLLRAILRRRASRRS